MPAKHRQSLIKNKIICPICITPVLESDDALDCDDCKKTLHVVCTKLEKKTIDKLLNDSSLEYKCLLCKPDDNNVMGELANIKIKLNQLDDIQNAMKFMSEQYDTILKGVKQNTKKITNLEKENKALRDEVKSLKSSVKLLNDIRVQNNCIINGINAKDDSIKPSDIVLDIAKKTGVNISAEEIDGAYFLGRSNTSTRKRSIVVKFNSKENKEVFMKEKKNMKTIDELKNVYIYDFLSKETLEIFNYAKSVGYNFVYVKWGNVFIRKNGNSKQIKINSMDDIDRILLNSARGAPRGEHVAVISENDDDEDDNAVFKSVRQKYP